MAETEEAVAATEEAEASAEEAELHEVNPEGLAVTLSCWEKLVAPVESVRSQNR